ncbi:hypothetical protein [Acidaminococcus fermentans]|uniref:hypothetical protein n=1 Tax=Acidaminococcus fermentans TaxID=905 RepID=UPI0030794C86
MTREILFRGYCPDLGRWIYGDLLHCGSELTEHYTRIEPRLSIAEEGIPAHEVDQRTVGMCSGFNGFGDKKLYDGDVCHVLNHEELRGIVKYSSYYGKWLFEFEDKKFKNQTVLEGGKIELYNCYLCLVKNGTIYDEYIKEKWGCGE